MIQFNLLPDVKLEFIKTRRLKRLVTISAAALSALALAVLILFVITVDVVQKKSLHDLQTDITSNSQKIKSIKDLDKILTVQNQLNTLSGLHDKKVVSSRLFDYLPQFTPQGITISSLSVDFTANTFTLSGNAPSLEAISGFVGTLKTTTYQTDTSAKETKAFTNVSLTSFAKGAQGSNSTYATSFSFDPILFDHKQTVKLSVPKSVISNTTTLFQTGSQ